MIFNGCIIFHLVESFSQILYINFFIFSLFTSPESRIRVWEVGNCVVGVLVNHGFQLCKPKLLLILRTDFAKICQRMCHFGFDEGTLNLKIFKVFKNH